MNKDITVAPQQSIAQAAVTLIAMKNSDVDQGLLANKINMIIAKTPKVGSMGPEAISQAILKAMIPDPTLQDHNDIYFVPYGKSIDVSFSHNYLQKLAYRKGSVKLIEPIIIYENDNVTMDENGLRFNINPFKKDRGEFAGVLVIVKLANGETKHGIVSAEHIDNAKKASRSGSSGPWKTWFLEMAKKVAIKNTLKGLDISSEFNAAVEIDDEDTDFSKANKAEAPKAAESLTTMMKTGSKNVGNIEAYLDSLSISYEVKGDWVMIDVINSNEDGVAKVTSNAKFVEKEDRPGMLFGKMSGITGEV